MDGNSRVVEILGEALRENFQSLMFQIKVGQYTKHDRVLQQRLKLLDRIYNHVKVYFQNNSFSFPFEGSAPSPFLFMKGAF